MPDSAPLPDVSADVQGALAACDAKFFLRSRVYQGVLVMLLALVAPLLKAKLGLVIDDPEAAAGWLTDQAGVIVGLVGAAWAAWGRARATQPIRLLPKARADG